jgi:hypothetical protein
VAYVLPTGAATGEIAKLRTIVAKYYSVYELRVTPRSLLLLVHPDEATLAEKFDSLRQELWPMNYVASIRREGAETVVEVLRMPVRSNWRPVANLVLLALTTLTCLFAGAFLWVAYVGGNALDGSAFLWGGLTFTLPLLAILGIHEMGHYVVARHRHVEASLPFFLPVPPPFLPIGTMGAFISLREPIPDRRTLLEIGAAGPLAGFAVAVPVTIAGLFLSSHHPLTIPLSNCGPVFVGVPYGDLIFGQSLIYYALGLFFPLGALTSINPLALAGWVGLLVTAMNLLPAGQLDGGHVFRALFGPRSVWVSWTAIGLLFGLGFLYAGWWLIGILILLLGPRHPPPLNDITKLTPSRQLIGAAAAIILVTGFVVVPLATPTGGLTVTSAPLADLGNPDLQTMAEINYSLSNSDLLAHAYTVNATVVVNGANSSAARAFLLQDSWTLYLPHGRTLRVAGSSDLGNFSMPGAAYFSLNATGESDSATNFTLLIEDPVIVVRTLTITVTIGELCASTWELVSFSPNVQTFNYPNS